MAPRHVVLVGMMGAGKTTVGRLAAAQLGWRFVDTDDEIAAGAGRTIPEIFQEQGEAAFRRLESAALAAALAGEAASVIATGGGVVQESENRARLRPATGGAGGAGEVLVVHLDASVEALVARVDGGAGRPLLAADAAGAVRALAARRAPLYREVAAATIATDACGPEEAAAEIVGMCT
ncbi:MAG: shikimate kinase [Acidimicrobiales bacterium]